MKIFDVDFKAPSTSNTTDIPGGGVIKLQFELVVFKNTGLLTRSGHRLIVCPHSGVVFKIVEVVQMSV